MFFLVVLALSCAQARDTAQSYKQWLRLGHYQKSWFGYKSDVAGEGFFLSPNGKKSPDAELKATIEAFLKQPILGKEDEHAQCRFPARLKWLIQTHGLKQERLPRVNCERYHSFKKRLSTESVSLVFSSYYLNNPSSAFGHTLIRMNKKGAVSDVDGKRNELLDNGINYAANPTTHNAVLYALYGLFGGFTGTFTNIPYYYKVREYNDFESRDLWSYDLNLTQDETDFLEAHFWELGASHFNYYYLTQNCSYHMLTALEAAVPRLELTSKLPFWIIPVDTIKVVYRSPELVKAISFRPSARTQFFYRSNLLTEEELKKFEEIIVEKDLQAVERKLKDLNDVSRVNVLDTVLDFMDYQHPEDVIHQASDSAKQKQNFLIARSKVPVQSHALQLSPKRDTPHFSHDSARAQIKFTTNEHLSSAAVELGMRFALHDLLDPSVGYPENSQIEFMHLRGRWAFSEPLPKLTEAMLFRIMNLNALSKFQKKPSWRGELGIRRAFDKNCNNCLLGGGETGVGAAFKIGPVVSFLLAEAETSGSPYFFTSKFRLGAGPRLGILVHFSDSIKWLSEVVTRYYLFSQYRAGYFISSRLRLSLTEAISMELSAQKTSVNDFELGLAGFYYF